MVTFAPSLPRVASIDVDAHRQVRDLYLRHADALRALLARLTWQGADADDLLQEVFIIALRSPGPLLAAQSPRSWLYGISVKVAANARRAHSLRRFFHLEDAHGVPSSAASADSALDSHQRVHRALGQLPAKKREVLVLFELEELSGAEIAEVLSCPLQTVWTRLHHARKAFEVELRRQEIP